MSVTKCYQVWTTVLVSNVCRPRRAKGPRPVCTFHQFHKGRGCRCPQCLEANGAFRSTLFDKNCRLSPLVHILCIATHTGHQKMSPIDFFWDWSFINPIHQLNQLAMYMIYLYNIYILYIYTCHMYDYNQLMNPQPQPQLYLAWPIRASSGASKSLNPRVFFSASKLQLPSGCLHGYFMDISCVFDGWMRYESDMNQIWMIHESWWNLLVSIETTMQNLTRNLTRCCLPASPKLFHDTKSFWLQTL